MRIPSLLNGRAARVARRYMATGQIRAHPPREMIARLLGGRDCFFVQVGSNDGIGNDPLHDAIRVNPQWRGLFIEPLDEPFRRLLAHYPADAHFRFEQVAIADAAGERPFFHVSLDTISQSGLHVVANQFGSFDRSLVLRNLTRLGVKDPESKITADAVRCDTLTSVLDKHRVERIDLFHVDTEGYDFDVLKQLDFSRYRPKVILYEHFHLGPKEAAAATLLRRQGYRAVPCGVIDTIAVRRD